MEQIQKKPQAAQPLKPQAPTVQAQEVPGSGDVNDAVNKALGKVQIIHGASEGSYDVSGKSISYVREALADILNFAPDAQALVNGAAVNENTILNANDVLEFVKQSGVKG